MSKVCSYERLEAWTPMAGGAYIYRWGIAQNDVVRVDGELTWEATMWSANEVEIRGPFTVNELVEAVLTEQWPVNYEQKLLNEYNAVTLGVLTGDQATAAVEKYSAFLRERKALKEQVEQDYQLLLKRNK